MVIRQVGEEGSWENGHLKIEGDFRNIAAVDRCLFQLSVTDVMDKQMEDTNKQQHKSNQMIVIPPAL